MDPRSVQNLVNDQREKPESIERVKPNVNFIGAPKMSAPCAEFSIYSHDEFKIDRPANWIIITNPKASTEKFVVIFKDPPLDSIAALSIEIEQNIKNMPIYELPKLDLMSLEHEVPKFKLVEITNTFDWAGQPASKIVFDGLMQDRLVRQMRISTIKNSRLYRLVFICEAMKFQERLPTAIHVVDSFDFTTGTHSDNGTIKNNSR
jgi:hypothetical protein